MSGMVAPWSLQQTRHELRHVTTAVELLSRLRPPHLIHGERRDHLTTFLTATLSKRKHDLGGLPRYCGLTNYETVFGALRCRKEASAKVPLRNTVGTRVAVIGKLVSQQLRPRQLARLGAGAIAKRPTTDRTPGLRCTRLCKSKCLSARNNLPAGPCAKSRGIRWPPWWRRTWRHDRALE